MLTCKEGGRGMRRAGGGCGEVGVVRGTARVPPQAVGSQRISANSSQGNIPILSETRCRDDSGS